MTTTAVADDLLGVGLGDHERQRVDDGRPDARAPEEAHKQRNVEMIAAATGSRLHDVTVLSFLIATELLWFVALGYGLLHLLQ